MTRNIAEIISKLPSVSEVVGNSQLMAKKSLGQNFLFDLNITRRIVREAAEDNIDFTKDTLIEVGSGPGALTRAILEREPYEFFVIEKDDRFVEVANELADLYDDNMQVISDDALRIDIKKLGSGKRHIIANLPYNISTKLLTNWLGEIEHISSMTLMFQKEVAERICAKPDSEAYGRLSVITNWLCKSAVLFDINKRAFTPPPKITSSLVRLIPRTEIIPADFAIMEKVTAAAFGQRRKMLRSSLKTLGVDSDDLCAKAGIDSSLRAEKLDIESFCRLATTLKTML